MKTENQPVRIAQMMTDMNYGGAETAVMNIYRHIDRNRYQFDFFALEGSELPQRQEIEKLGGRIYVVPRLKFFPAYIGTVTGILRENQYPVVHSHMNSLSVFSLFAARQAGIPVRIAHSHSVAGKGETGRNLIKCLLRELLKPLPTHRAACSEPAGEWLFGPKKDFQILPNGVDFSEFSYDPVLREKARQKLRLEGKFVVGNVGRFCYAKNHTFLLEIFQKIRRQQENAVLLLVGEGILKEKIQSRAEAMGLKDSVLFLNPRLKIQELYDAMDVFLLPSRYEGLGMAALEAQASGLPCILSQAVPAAGRICPDCRCLPMDVELWAQAALEAHAENRQDVSFLPGRVETDIQKQAESWMDFYEKVLGEKGKS